MASNKILCDKLSKKQNRLAKSEVCAKNIFHLSNNGVKAVLSKYSSLSLDEQNIVRKFSAELQTKHLNRYRNLSNDFKAAFVCDTRENRYKNRVSIKEKNELIDVNVSNVSTFTTTNKIEQEVVTNKPSVNNNSIAPLVTQESTIPSFHTNIISRVSNNLVNINPFYSTKFQMIHQKVINQCFPSILPQVIMHNAINNITAVLNLTQNINTIHEPVNNQINTPEKEFVPNFPSNIQSETSDIKCVSQIRDKKFEKSNLDSVKRNETENFNKSRNGANNEKKSQSGKDNEDAKNSKYHKENKYKNNNYKKEVPTKNESVHNYNSSIATSNNTNAKESKVVQDLESFSMEHMKKIESFAQKNALKNSIKLNLSSNSQQKISETYCKIKQHTESKTINLNDIKPFFDDTETNLNTQHKTAKETKIVKTSYDNADKRLNDNLKNDQKNVKLKVIKDGTDGYSKEKSRKYSNDYHRKSASSKNESSKNASSKNAPSKNASSKNASSKNVPSKNAPSKSAFLDECNFLKSIISKNSNMAEIAPKKKEKLEVIVTKKSKKKRKKDKKRFEDFKRIKLDNELNQVISKETLEGKKQIDLLEIKTVSSDTDLIKIENVEQVDQFEEINKKKQQKREVKVVNRVLRSDSPNDQIIKSISEKPFSEECNKITNDTTLETKQDVNCKLEKTMDYGDLMVLLKYFYKLDGLEQHRLIEFLKELELTEPERVADLRKHVRTSPPEDEEYKSNSQLDAVDKDPVELDERPESRNSDLSNIDLILEDIDSILNDEDDEESTSNKVECTEIASSKQLKSCELVKNDAKCDSTVSLGKTIPVQFKNCQNYTFHQNSNSYSIQYNNVMQQNINYIGQCQNYGLNQQNQYLQNNLQQTYQQNAQLFTQNQSIGLQNQQNLNGYQNFQNFCFNYNNQGGHYQQHYSNYQNSGYFQ